jgi:hypothetical protein
MIDTMYKNCEPRLPKCIAGRLARLARLSQRSRIVMHVGPSDTATACFRTVNGLRLGYSAAPGVEPQVKTSMHHPWSKLNHLVVRSLARLGVTVLHIKNSITLSPRISLP